MLFVQSEVSLLYNKHPSFVAEMNSHVFRQKSSHPNLIRLTCFLFDNRMIICVTFDYPEMYIKRIHTHLSVYV
jgi:hypothetical protein